MPEPPERLRRIRRHRLGPRRRGGLVPIAWPIGDLLHRAGCPEAIVAEVFAAAAFVDDAAAAPLSAGKAANARR